MICGVSLGPVGLHPPYKEPAGAPPGVISRPESVSHHRRPATQTLCSMAPCLISAGMFETRTRSTVNSSLWSGAARQSWPRYG